ncbi:RNA polymerase sigma factor [Dactylosporangium sp. CA-092794]|uniref:RNA polymerase sigma factor n=1 Tax=Dactylosporangium sp. CA-092794 TaxID=3239929 RepID=UPI003D8A82F0
MAALTDAARDSYGKLLALLSAATSDLAAAEDALADAFERAVRTWPDEGVPANPDAWLLTVARNRLRDRWRSAEFRRTVVLDVERDAPVHVDDVDVDAIPDRRLELMLVCVHPAIDRAMHTPLMLNTVLGRTAEQIGRAFSTPASTMATRLVRAKRRIKIAGIPFRLPDRADLPARMVAVLEAVYGVHAIDRGRLPSAGLQLAELLTTLVPDDPEAHGLAALVQLSAARAGAGTDARGRFVPLSEQDPAAWDQRLIARAHEHLRAAHARGRLGRFQIEAAIQAVHGARARTGTTDWPTLLDLHRLLRSVAPSLGGDVALAAVTAEVDGPAAGLARLDAVLADAGEPARRFQPAAATRAHLLERLGRGDEAVAAYDTAIGLTHDHAEREYLQHRRTRLGGTSCPQDGVVAVVGTGRSRGRAGAGLVDQDRPAVAEEGGDLGGPVEVVRVEVVHAARREVGEVVAGDEQGAAGGDGGQQAAQRGVAGPA